VGIEPAVTTLRRPVTAEEAVAGISSGDRVFIGSGAAEPVSLVEAMTTRAHELRDVNVLHIFTMGWAQRVLSYSKRLRTLQPISSSLVLAVSVRCDVHFLGSVSDQIARHAPAALVGRAHGSPFDMK
jgi:acyl-CoA hydrolase